MPSQPPFVRQNLSFPRRSLAQLLRGLRRRAFIAGYKHAARNPKQRRQKLGRQRQQEAQPESLPQDVGLQPREQDPALEPDQPPSEDPEES